MPGPLAEVHPGETLDMGVLLGLCPRCVQAHRRLPAGTVQKRLNAAAGLAARDDTRRYWTARFPDAGAARLAAGMLGRPESVADMLAALGWR
jgi:hypothetical protein